MVETNPNPPNLYLKVILRWFFVAFVIFVLTVLTGIYITWEILPKVYTATAQIQIGNESDKIDASLNGPYPSPHPFAFNPESFQAELEIMQAPDVLLPVIHDLNLDKIWAKRVFKQDQLPDKDALAYMHKILKLDCIRGTNIVEITAVGEVPKEAADIANTVADRYKTMRDVEEDQRDSRGADSLRDQVAQQQKVVDDRKTAMEKLLDGFKEAGVKIPPVTDGRLEPDLEARKKDLLMAKEDYDARQVLLNSVTNLPDDQLIATLNGLGRADPNITSLQAEASQKQADIDNLLKDGFEENHPRVQAIRAELDLKKKQIADLIAGTRRAMRIDTEMAKSRIALLQNEVDDLTAKGSSDNASGLPPFRNAQRDLDQQQALLGALTIRLRQIEADRQLLESPVRILSRAEPPTEPSQPNKILSFAMTLIIGFFLSILVATLLEIIFWLRRRP